mmetsp:Transcript_11274/g.22851  ORF Transcript_11274/g.22851 Transcript_11274/m.22851 type:complete len:226 (-) Transcript_11274:1194-1871(-)
MALSDFPTSIHFSTASSVPSCSSMSAGASHECRAFMARSLVSFLKRQRSKDFLQPRERALSAAFLMAIALLAFLVFLYLMSTSRSPSESESARMFSLNTCPLLMSSSWHFSRSCFMPFLPFLRVCTYFSPLPRIISTVFWGMAVRLARTTPLPMLKSMRGALKVPPMTRSGSSGILILSMSFFLTKPSYAIVASISFSLLFSAALDLAISSSSASIASMTPMPCL